MNEPTSILDYLRTQMPAYPFDPQLDAVFVEELIADFAEFNILEETKTFRWYYNNCPASRLKNLRAGLRRWISNSRFRVSGAEE
jgi:hypothetical protein